MTTNIQHIVFIVCHYYPFASANGNCAGKLAEEYAKRGFRVTVVCQKQWLGQEPNEQLRGCQIVRVSCRFNDRYVKYRGQASRKGIEGVWGKIRFFLIKLGNWMRVVLGHDSSNREWRTAFHKALCSLNLDDTHTLLVPLCFPMEALLAAADYHVIHSRSRMIPWLLDMYADSSTLHRTSWNRRLKYKRHEQQERYVLGESTQIIYLSSWGAHLRDLRDGDMARCHEIGLPLASCVANSPSVRQSKERVELVYLGSLLKKERNPQPALKVVSRYAEKYQDFRFLIYHMGNCESIINKFVAVYPDLIVNCGAVDNRRAALARESADVLVLIGNSHAVQLPSKIYEYMSTRKSILFFVKDDNDPLVPLLNKYGNALIVREEDPGSIDVDELHRFFHQPSCPGESIASILEKNTPQFIADYILELIRKQ